MPAKFNLLVAASIPAVALVPLLACGGGGSGKADAPVIVTHDSGSNGSGSATCTFASSFTPTVTASATKYQKAGSGANPIKWNENSFTGLIRGSAGGSDEQVIRVLIFGGCGTTGTTCAGGSGAPGDATPDWPVVFAPKSDLDLAATVGSGSAEMLAHDDILVLLLGDPDTTKFNTIYVAVAGVVNVTTAANGSGSAFAGNGSGLDFVHVNSDFSQAADGCESLVPTFSWNGATFTAKQLVGAPELDATTVNALRRRTY
jgi:hypothetical protein